MENTMYYRPTKAIIDLDAIQENVKALKKYLGSKSSIMAVVKADGYGHGDVEIAQAALKGGAGMVSVATPEEAIRLRKFGISEDILVMAPSPVCFAKKAAKLGITVTVSGVEWLESVIQAGETFEKPLKIHIKIDCGMGRYGLQNVGALQSIVGVLQKTEEIVLDGVFTHFSCADDGHKARTEKQYKVFMQYIHLLPKKPRLIHASNSAAAILYPEFALDAVRFGIGLYGIAPSDTIEERLPFPLKRALVLESELALVKKVKQGSPISYGGTYTTEEDEWIGTIPIGYADGLRRGLRGQEVLIGGERMPIVGTICMDQCMVKLPRKIPVGEKVILIGKQGNEEIKLEEWAERLDTIPYEIAVSFAKRIPRIYHQSAEC